MKSKQKTTNITTYMQHEAEKYACSAVKRWRKAMRKLYREKEILQPLNLLKFAGKGEGPRDLSTEKHKYE